MYVKVMAAVIACILMSGETHSTSATIPATENQSWFKKRKKKPEQEEKTKSDYEKLVEGSKITKGMFAVHQKKNDYCEMESGAEGYESLCQGNFD